VKNHTYPCAPEVRIARLLPGLDIFEKSFQMYVDPLLDVL
jgi:hypothetical protein